MPASLQSARRAPSPSRTLLRLAALRTTFGGDVGAERLRLLQTLAGCAFRRASEVERLHELLCFAAAYPDTEAVFAQASTMLGAFAERPDLARARTRLENSGIAGTDLVYPFFASTARWLVDRWPAAVTVDWGHDERTDVIEARLPLLTAWSERAVFDEPPLAMREWLDRLRGPETDAAFLVRRSLACTGSGLLGHQLFDELGLTLRVHSGPGTPARSTARMARRVAVQGGPLRTARPDLRTAALEAPKHASDVPRRDADRLVDLARSAMVTRKRDLYSFAAADPRDVHLVDCGDGLDLVFYGVRPEQRLLLDAVYSFLILRNGVPIGYGLAGTLWRSAEIAFNLFDTFRGAEAGWVYGRILGTIRSMFGVDTFTVFPYQLGHDNDEGLASGAWWFYYKMGFRPRDPEAAALARQEADRAARRRGYRTGPATLRRLVRAHMFLSLNGERDDVIGLLPTDRLALAATNLLTTRFGSDRERAAAFLADENAERLSAGRWRQWPDGERLFWERWAPLVALLSDLDRWSPQERQGLVEIIRAKGSQRESSFVGLFDDHPHLRASLLAVASCL